jgi:hypothetical protein
MKPAEARGAGLLRGQPQSEVLQSLRQCPIEPLRLGPILEGADVIIRVADEERLAATTPGTG